MTHLFTQRVERAHTALPNVKHCDTGIGQHKIEMIHDRYNQSNAAVRWKIESSELRTRHSAAPDLLVAGQLTGDRGRFVASVNHLGDLHAVLVRHLGAAVGLRKRAAGRAGETTDKTKRKDEIETKSEEPDAVDTGEQQLVQQGTGPSNTSPIPRCHLLPP
jgi:hypothetical protein